MSARTREFTIGDDAPASGLKPANSTCTPRNRVRASAIARRCSPSA